MFWQNISYLMALLCLVGSSPAPVVVSRSGTVAGWERLSRDGHPYEAFTGIPYAEPPIGELRFQSPKPARRWKGTLNATGDMTPCAQYPSTPDGSENCLFLSVYRPKCCSNEKIPVIVRIHGGAFQTGSAAPREAADYFMDHNVILVLIHYRLNIFGFISLGDAVVPGNYGLKDQVMALRWVNQNIEAFGGDPNSVTLVGESAGGASTHILLKSPVTKYLVTRAVSDSGTANPIWSLRTPDLVKNHTMKVAASVGCSNTTSEENLKCMQQVDANILLDVIQKEILSLDPPFGPVIEREDVEDAVATEDLSLVPSEKPWITGACNGEHLLYTQVLPNQIVQNAANNLNSFLENLICDYTNCEQIDYVKEEAQILIDLYFSERRDIGNITLGLAKMVADVNFIYPMVYNMNKHNGDVWAYYLEYVGEVSNYNQSSDPEERPVAGHAATALLYLNERSQHENLSPYETAADYRVSKRHLQFLINFARYGDPTPPGSDFIWKKVRRNEILRISSDGKFTLEGKSFYRQFEHQLGLWSFVVGWSR